MTEFQVVQRGGTEFLITERIGELLHVIASAGNRDYAEKIVAALTFAANNSGEVRRSWDDLAR